MPKNKKSRTIEDLFVAKKRRRQDLARLPVEEKVKILVQLQKIAIPIPILAARGIKKVAWDI